MKGRVFIDGEYSIPRLKLIGVKNFKQLYYFKNLIGIIFMNIVSSIKYIFLKPINDSLAVCTSVFCIPFFPFRKFEVSMLEICGKSNFFDFKNMIDEMSGVKRFFARIIEVVFGWYFRIQLRKFDLLCVATPDLLKYAQRIRSDAFWLPQLVEPIVHKVEKNETFRVFIPTRLARIKGIERVVELLKVVRDTLKDYEVILVDWGSERWVIDSVKSDHKKVRVLPLITDRKVYEQLLVSSDLVFGQFGYGTGACGRIELEAMAAKVPLVAFDRYESSSLIKFQDKLDELVRLLIVDKAFRHDFVERNYKDVMMNHSSEHIRKLLTVRIEGVIKS